MTRLSRNEALNLAASFGINLHANFHALNAFEIDSIRAAADYRGYRKPKNANGSRARYFYAYLQRAATDRPFSGFMVQP